MVPPRAIFPAMITSQLADIRAAMVQEMHPVMDMRVAVILTTTGTSGRATKSVHRSTKALGWGPACPENLTKPLHLHLPVPAAMVVTKADTATKEAAQIVHRAARKRTATRRIRQRKGKSWTGDNDLIGILGC